jgi:dTDP-4-dehydrorhamnose reductase
VRVLVLGGGGQVAQAVAKAAPAQHQVLIKTRADLDIADAGAVATLLADSEFDWIVNAAAYTAVDQAEGQGDRAFAVNDTAVGLLATAAARADCRLLHISTDFVFDGRTSRAYLPSDPPNPLSIYGRSKLGGENRVRGAGGDGLVLRSSWVYAAAGRNFVLTMLRLMRELAEVRVVCDQIGAPTWAASLAGAIWGLIESAAPGGIYHWTDLGVASWYDFAVAIQDEALIRGLLSRSVPIVPIATGDYPTPARRPAFSLLNTDSTRALVSIPAQHWRHNLRKMMDELRTG